jgi:hypothetical protein
MTDQPQAVEEVVTETQPEPMPSSDQQTSDTVEPTSDGESTPDVERPELELPRDAKERTQEQFEKLKTQLADERARRMRLERAFSYTPQPQAQVTPDWFDPDTQSVDVNKLQQRETNLQQKISTLENQLSGITRKEEQIQEQETYAVYPELDPSKSGTFDERFHKQLISYMATEYAEGHNITMKQAADDIVALAEKRAKKAEKIGAQKALESLVPKEQAALEATGRSDRRNPGEDLETLRAQTRMGGKSGMDAIMKRLARIPSA